MRPAYRGENGQALVEFALLSLLLFALTLGLIDVGRAFYDYNALASAAQEGARFGAVSGGTCVDGTTPAETAPDWCNQLGFDTSGNGFWAQQGNAPAQGNAACPTSYSQPAVKNASYQLSNLPSHYTSTIVGAVLQRLDTTVSNDAVIVGDWSAGLTRTQVYVCIQTSDGTPPVQGDTVTVFVYYPFKYASGIVFGDPALNLVASSQYTVE